MTRERKEIQKQMFELEMQEQADYELGCEFFSQEISEAFRPAWNTLYDRWAATYGQTQKEHADYVFQKQCEAFDAGRIPYSPCYGCSYM